MTLTTRGRNQLLGVLFIGVLMAALDIAIVGPALPMIQASFAIGERELAWVFAIYVLFSLIGTPLMAKLSDTYGRRTIYVANVALFAGGSLMIALAPSFAIILLGRALQGLGAGGIFPVAAAVIGDTFPVEQRGSALGLIGAVFGIAFLLGPILGGLLLLAGWQWLFLINLPIAALVIVLSLRLLPTARPAEQLPFDWPGMGILSVMLGALAYALNQIDTTSFTASITTAPVLPLVLLALVLVPIFVSVERRAVDPLVRLSLFASRQVRIVAGLAVGAGLSETAVVFVPALLVLAFGVSSSTASFMLLPLVLAMAIGSPVSGRMLDRRGSRSIVVAGSALIAVALLILGFFGDQIVPYYIFAIIFGLGIAVLLGASLRYIMLNEAREQDRAAAQGVLTLCTGIGQLVGSVLVGAIAQSRGGGVSGYSQAFLAVGVVMVILTLVALGLKGRALEQQSRVQKVPA